MKMIFRELYLFSPHDQTAKKIEFKEGINIITSNQENGTDRGKSVIMRSLYHALGAESYLDSKWDTKSKVYILKFLVDKNQFFIYRTDNLYKLFDGDKHLLFVCTRSRELAEKLKEITGFAVRLPGRNDQLEITPPVYNYLPFFLDQDHYDGSHYTAFKNLQMYSNFKDSVLFYHLGIYDEAYFELRRQWERLTKTHNVHCERLDLLHAMQQDIESKLGAGSYSSDIEALRKDVELYRREYAEVFSKLNKSKLKLIELRNNLLDLESLFAEMQSLSASNEKQIKQLGQHKCPECGSVITDTVSLKSKRYNLEEDIIVVKNDLQTSIQTVTHDIEFEEQKYADFLQQLQIYDEKVKFNAAQIDDVIRYRGLCEIRESVVDEKKELVDAIDDENEELDVVKKKMSAYNARKKKVEDRYYSLLVSARTKFGLNEIEPDKFKKMTTNFNASGSNKNIATVIWFLTVLSLRREFNPDAIEFPVVFDSPNNVETDNVKKHDLLQYILDNTVSSQMILSSIGFVPSEFSHDDINLITLDNEKYHLLDSNSYEKYSPLLTELCDAGEE
jgi:hypothetical protein